MKLLHETYVVDICCLILSPNEKKLALFAVVVDRSSHKLIPNLRLDWLAIY